MSATHAIRPMTAPLPDVSTDHGGCCGGRCRSASAPASPASQAAGVLLDQCAGFLRRITDDLYRSPSAVLMGSTIGQHVRHSLDHFAAAAKGLAGEPIDYDRRERATPIETDRHAALTQIAVLRSSVGEVSHARAGESVRVLVMLSADGGETELLSSVAREIAFAAHHATHHHAMMAAIAAEHGVAAPPGFGKAPSTLNFEGVHAG